MAKPTYAGSTEDSCDKIIQSQIEASQQPATCGHWHGGRWIEAGEIAYRKDAAAPGTGQQPTDEKIDYSGYDGSY